MKTLDLATSIAQEFVSKEDQPFQDVLRLLKSSQRKTERLEESLEQALDLLVKIRYCNWPAGVYEFFRSLELVPDNFDEVINDGDAALRSSRRSSKKS